MAEGEETKEKDEGTNDKENSTNEQETHNVDDSAALTNATKQILTSICSVWSLFFDEKYKNDYHVSLEKVMELKKFEHGERAVSYSF